MFQPRDYSVFLPSPNAEREFRKLRRLDFLVNGLIIVLIALCIWNILTLVELRLITNQDLAEVRSITDDLSTRLIWALGLVTLIVIILREWLMGERSIGIIYPLTALLAIGLVPAVMSEIQPPLEDQTLRVVMYDCPPKAIVNDRLSSIGRCVPQPVNDDELLMSTSNPVDGPVKPMKPSSSAQNNIVFTMAGRGTYTVYFMFQFENMAACNEGMIFQRGSAPSDSDWRCIDYDDLAWMVMPHTTAGNRPSSLHMIQVQIP